MQVPNADGIEFIPSRSVIKWGMSRFHLQSRINSNKTECGRVIPSHVIFCRIGWLSWKVACHKCFDYRFDRMDVSVLDIIKEKDNE